MCLITTEPYYRIAKEDISVIKYVIRSDGVIKTPYTKVEIPVNKIMKASSEKEEAEFLMIDILNNDMYSISEGAIHAKLIVDNFHHMPFELRKAIIPAGTKYWISSNGTEIAAKEMIVTNQVFVKKIDRSSENIFKEILSDAPEFNGIRVGDYLLENGEYVKPQKNLSKNDIVGIVVGFSNKKPLIAALSSFTCNSKIPIMRYYNNIDMYNIPFNGKKITELYIKGKNNKLEAFEICTNYRKEKGENWYFGAVGEVLTMLNNIKYINAANQITGIEFDILNSWICSCSKFKYNNVWCCSHYYGELYTCITNINTQLKLIPFLDK